METNELNFVELLKGHEGETFYSPTFGDLKFKGIEDDGVDNYPLEFEDANDVVYLSKDGKYYEDAELTLFPSKGQRDWNKWIKEYLKLPRTWVEYERTDKYDCTDTITKLSSDKSPVGKSLLALYKIYKLIEVGYGGNITDAEWRDTEDWKFTIRCSADGILYVEHTIGRASVAFHKRKQAEKFLAHPENIQLIKDFYIV